jgi:predicted amidohydrolase YtcJ
MPTLPIRTCGALVGALLPALACAQAPVAPARAEIIVTNARIHTVDEGRPLAEAMAIAKERITFVGSAREALALRGAQTRVVDMGGRTIIPGMTDAHAHLSGLGKVLREVDLVGTTSYAEVIARVAEKARTVPKGTWILGRGWDQNDWGETTLPTHGALSQAVPDHPVLLQRVDGHASLANALAMRLAGITAQTVSPSGGRIEKDASGEPTGVLVDDAEGLVEAKVPPPTAADNRAWALAAIEEAQKWGLTGVHEMGVGRETVEVYEQLAREGKFGLRNYVYVSGDSANVAWALARGPKAAQFDGRLWVRGFKLYADGALGSRGAALLSPYADEPHNLGLTRMPPAYIRAVAERSLRAGFQMATHAIGDRANRQVLDAYEAALRAVPVADHRFRIEHAQIIHHQDIPRFAQLGVIPSMQASHQTSDMYWVANRLGTERLRGAYAWRSLLQSGVIIPNGSDFPVELVNPLISFHAAIARQDADDFPAGGWFPEQRMTREEALRSMTLWPAMAAFQEQELGSLTPGKHADFVVLDQDIMRIPAELVLRTKVLQTWLGGTVVYDAAQPRR